MLTLAFQDGKTYNPWYAYGQSKTANILFAHSLAEKLAKKGAQAYVIHPGLITSSNLMNNVSQEMFMDGWKIAVEANGGKPVAMEEAKPLEAGCSTALVAALDPALKGNILSKARVFEVLTYNQISSFWCLPP